MSTLPEKRITDFIKKHHVLTLATTVNNQPYCANCFYVYLPEHNVWVFSSDMQTRHITEVQQNHNVAASIVLETQMVGKIQGLQITGSLIDASQCPEIPSNQAYLLRYPFAVLAQTHLWVLKPDMIKMTDNRLGFGKKLIWTTPL